MCGICGLIDLTGTGRADPAMARQMAGLMQHRGPDGDGFYAAPNVALGMRRLSIIDVAGSDQPLYNEDGSLVLVFNGEIYNYRELRDDLIRRGHQPRTQGDGETLVHLYETYGLNLFRYLRGMYAFALWDAHAERLVLAVDHIGMKPLYLHEQDGLLWFASETKALFANPNMPRGLNLAALDTYLAFGYMIGPETLFEGVRRLPPGHVLVVEQGRARIERYWDFPDFVPSAASSGTQPDNWRFDDADEIIAQARALLTESVHLHLRSDVPLGLFLSGGIDSAAVLSLMAREASGRIKTYTIGYAMRTPDNELEQARRIAAHFNTEHHERVITAQDWWEGLLRYVYAHDEPNANPSAVSLLLLSEDTARQVKVVLTGLGGDELFGGYGHHRLIPQLLERQAGWGRWLSPARGALAALEPYYPQMKRYRIIGALPTYLPQLRQAALPRDEALLRLHSFDGMVFSDALRDQLYGADLRAAAQQAQHRARAYGDILRQSWREDPFDTAQALIINTWLTGNALLSQDKTAMAHALEARVPFFDPVLLRFAARVPSAVRMQRNKWVLRAAVTPFLPDFALQRPKQAFNTPIMRWFEDDLRAPIQALLRDPGAEIRAWFDSSGLDRLLDAHFSGSARHTEVIFRLLLLELWQQTFMRTALHGTG